MKKKTFNELVMLARQDTPPAVDVADSVIAALTKFSVPAVCANKAYMWMGVASAVAACIVVAATFAWHAQADSVNEMLTYVSWVSL